MGETCSTHGSYKKFIQYFGWKLRTEETTWKNFGNIILEWILEMDGRVWTGCICRWVGSSGGLV